MLVKNPHEEESIFSSSPPAQGERLRPTTNTDRIPVAMSIVT